MLSIENLLFHVISLFGERKKKLVLIMLSLFSASWGGTGTDNGGAPQLKGARWFSYDELKKSTNNFSETNEIGFGGYGKVIIQEYHLIIF